MRLLCYAAPLFHVLSASKDTQSLMRSVKSNRSKLVDPVGVDDVVFDVGDSDQADSELELSSEDFSPERLEILYPILDAYDQHVSDGEAEKVWRPEWESDTDPIKIRFPVLSIHADKSDSDEDFDHAEKENLVIKFPVLNSYLEEEISGTYDYSDDSYDGADMHDESEDDSVQIVFPVLNINQDGDVSNTSDDLGNESDVSDNHDDWVTDAVDENNILLLLRTEHAARIGEDFQSV